MGLVLASKVAATDQAQQWVRVEHRAATPVPDSTAQDGSLNDYGSFSWGRMTGSQIEKLRQLGLNVSVETSPFEIRLGGQSFDPVQDLPAKDRSSASPDGNFYLIQFKGPIKKGWLQALRAQGIEPVQPLHPFSYLVWAEPAAVSSARSLPQVRWGGLMHSDWKLPPERRVSEPGMRPTMALASTHVDAGQLGERLAEFGTVHALTPMGRHFNLVHMTADGRDYPSIAELAGILTVQAVPPGAGPRGEMSNQSIVGNIDASGNIYSGYATWLNATDCGGKRCDGSGVTVAVVDGAVLATHQDLADRMAECLGTNGSCSASGSSGHGTHVAGAIAGTGTTQTRANDFLRGQGVAPGARIVSQVYGPFIDWQAPGAMVPGGMLRIFQDSVRSGAVLANNSWGSAGTPQGYDIPTRQVDMITRDADPDTAGNQSILPVWSIMNGNGDVSGSCAPSSLGSPDEAKNLLAVGSTWLQTSSGNQRSDIFSLSGNSAHGPACDGRRVPHIVAPGCYTDSTVDNSDTAHSSTYCGTSMASPVVTGAIAVWVEKYIDETGAAPSPALIKAVVTAAARNLKGERDADGRVMDHRPDRFQGYGRLDFDAVMDNDIAVFLYDQQTVFDETGQDWSLALKAVDPNQPVRIMLAWTDAPGHGLGGDTPAWVNNLDLSVNAGGQIYRGNRIDENGWSAGGGTDGSNNLEGVFLSPEQFDQPFAITVSATDLAGDALNPHDPGDPQQDFALACYNCTTTDPTYAISVHPDRLEACIPSTGSDIHDFTVSLDAIGSYSGSVELTPSPAPAGMTSTLTPDLAEPPAFSTWSLEISSSTAPGIAMVFVNGYDQVDQYSAALELDLDADLDAAPQLISPESGTSDQSLAPTFTWEEMIDADRYRIQIAGDETFDSLVTDEIVDTTSFTPADDLAKGFVYFWRVQGINNCGGGEWSQVFSLDTGLFTDRFETRL